MDKKYVSRRKFLKFFTAGGSFITVSPLLQFLTLSSTSKSRILNPYVSANGRPLLICVEGTNFSEMVKKGLKVIGGLKKLVKNNQDVLIKTELENAETYPALKEYSAVKELINTASRLTNGVINTGDENFQISGNIYYSLKRKIAFIESIRENNIVIINYFDIKKLITSGLKQKMNFSEPSLNIIKIPALLKLDDCPQVNFNANQIVVCGDITIGILFSINLIKSKTGKPIPLKIDRYPDNKYRNTLNLAPEIIKLRV